MSTDTIDRTSNRPSRGGRRRSRRGSRPRGNREGSSSSPQDHPSQTTHKSPKKEEKKGLLGKIVSFFTGGSPEPAPASKPKPRNRPAEAARETEKPKRDRSSIRKPERVEVTSPRLYVGNLSFDATESDLEELFAGVGQVQNAEVVCNRHTHRSKGFAFVEMTSIDEAKHAVETLHDQDYMGRKLVVSGAKAQPERSSAERQPEQ